MPDFPELPSDVANTFRGLLERARGSVDPEPTAMTLASLGPDGPSARTVLLKAFDERGFVFYTNLDSRKGRQLAADPRAALLFHWKHLDHGIQVHAEGVVESVTDAEADAYWATRPRESQLGGWASLQSQTLPDRATFEDRVAEAEARFAGGPVPRPPHWSGFRLRPRVVEFWYGARFRLHERQRWEVVAPAPAGVDGGWQRRMLYP
jgi:pyridoxamine 5'-phosphate oxidase